jgi:hypothetical protein
MTRSVFEYYHGFLIDSPDPSDEELPGELVFGEEADLEQGDGDTVPDTDVYVSWSREVCL